MKFDDICGLGVGAILIVWGSLGLWKYVDNPLPDKESLKWVSGPFERLDIRIRNTREGEEEDGVIRLKGKNGQYLYPSWFPEGEKIPWLLNEDDQIEILSDVGERYLVWELRQNGETLIDYDTLREVIEESHSSAPWRPLGFTMLGGFLIYRRLREWLDSPGSASSES